MQAKWIWLGGLTLVFGAFGSAPLHGRQASPPSPTISSADAPDQRSSEIAAPDISKLPFLQQRFYRSGQAGKDWLLRLNRRDGRFIYGLVPSLGVTLTEDNYLDQAAAAFALARAAKFYCDDRAAAVARQALLNLLVETGLENKKPHIRLPLAPGTNRLAAASWLVLAIHELPSPPKDLLQKAEQLCECIRLYLRDDGSVSYTGKSKKDAGDLIAARRYSGLALYALLRSQRHHQKRWKVDAARKARAFYRKVWRGDKNMEMIPWHSAAYAEAFLLTKEPEYLEFAKEMSDWLCTLQYKELQPQRLLWSGGFKRWENGTVQLTPPTINSATYIEGLAQSYRAVKEKGDVQRYQTYREAIERCGHFLTTLQYTEVKAAHFTAQYREQFILGGFHPHHQDGTLRIDYTQQAVCALVKYLSDVAEIH